MRAVLLSDAVGLRTGGKEMSCLEIPAANVLKIIGMDVRIGRSSQQFLGSVSQHGPARRGGIKVDPLGGVPGNDIGRMLRQEAVASLAFAKCFPGPFLLGDVQGTPRDTVDAAVLGAHRKDPGRDPPHGPVGTHNAILRRALIKLALPCPLQHLLDQMTVLLLDRLSPDLAPLLKLLDRPTPECLVGRTDVEEGARCFVHEPEDLARRVRDLPDASLTLDQILLHRMLLKSDFDGKAKLPLVKGLDQIPGGIGRTSPLDGRLIGVRRQVDNGNIKALPNLPGGLNAVHRSLQDDIGDEDIRMEFSRLLESLLARRGNGGDVESESAQTSSDVLSNDLLVFNE
jgi:hypothetical protein